MAEATQSIDPTRFALALESLPLENLHSKGAELRNSIAHLKSSNEQMLPFAEDGDQDCKEAMFENLAVIGRINERIGLLRAEVEKRGMLWGEVEDEGRDREGWEKVVNGDGGMVNGTVGAVGEERGVAPRQRSGRLTDEELRRQLEAQMGEDEEDGVHL